MKKQMFVYEVLLILCIGILMVYSSSYVWALYKFEDAFFYVKRQAIFAVLGFVLMLVFSKIDLYKIKKYNRILLIVSFLSLLLVLVPGIGVERNGSRSWFSLFSFLIQPSEFFKIAVILNVSEYLSKRKKIVKLKQFLIPILWTVLGFGLIMLQPDFGSGVVMLSSVVVILFCAKIPLKYFLYLALIAIVGLGGLVLSAPYRLTRILSFLDPFSDPLGSGFQIIQSLYALGPAGLFGNSYLESIQKNFYLPEPQTDFIFAIFGEEFGYFGSVLLVLLFLLLIYEGVKIAMHQDDYYKSYVCIGVISLFAIQVMINLGVVTGLLPVTGITLPLISYGGSSLLVVLTSFGLLLSNADK